jgi:hypothetical protein
MYEAVLPWAIKLYGLFVVKPEATTALTAVQFLPDQFVGIDIEDTTVVVAWSTTHSKL